MNKLVELERKDIETINGGGLFAAAAGAVLGVTYGFAAGAIVAAKTGQIKDVFKTAWTAGMVGGAIGAVIPAP